MPPQSPYGIIYAPIVKEHLRSIDRKYYTLIRTVIQERLAYEPAEENRNRKPLKRPAFETATWELRFGPDNMFRVFYEVQMASHEVHILAIGVKLRDTVFIGGEAIEL
ncbi:type II toxin-antitoxin system RelE family toxin [Candidatus Oscillochloris fontis]|uniref:type II toxin-antitoxin system RelE family toxin n=1 Tax=Candidatus Oscillochloris fontis TaxID=2496868 RepID=UPI00101C9651|nr:addiction module toxin RelE [Candidatus Oscillochloris fontis]